MHRTPNGKRSPDCQRSPAADSMIADQRRPSPAKHSRRRDRRAVGRSHASTNPRRLASPMTMHGIEKRTASRTFAAECFAGRRVYHNLLRRPEPFMPQRIVAQRLMKNCKNHNNFSPRPASPAVVRSRSRQRLRSPAAPVQLAPLKVRPPRLPGEFRLGGRPPMFQSLNTMSIDQAGRAKRA